MRHLLKRIKGRFGPVFQSDTTFIEAAYWEILGRPADQDGLNHYRALLKQGLGRSAVLLSLMRSDEFTSKLGSSEKTTLPDLRCQRPDQYRQVVDRSNGEPITIFEARSSADFDWLEEAILRNKYYEQPGVWNLGVDTDKRVIAEIMMAFAPERPLELGCAAGAVMECLLEANVAAEGIEISAMARDRASERVRSRIHHGDLISLDLPSNYDLVFGLDVFEHLNPNRMGEYIGRLAEITREEAYLFCNIPAFGQDEVFGTVFPLYVEGWERDVEAGRPFSTLHVDECGYPIHGHLTWAGARWWAGQFAVAGFERDTEIERALHSQYDEYIVKRSPARKAFFVFAKRPSHDRRTAIVRRILQGSRVLR